MRARRVGVFLTFLSFALAQVVLLRAARIRAQDAAEQTVLELNHRAMEAYNNLDVDRAVALLEEALRVAQTGAVHGSELAQTDANLAIVRIAGFGDNASGLRYFGDGLCADPLLQLDPVTSTPEIQKVFQEALSQHEDRKCPHASATPTTEAPAAANAQAAAAQTPAPSDDAATQEEPSLTEPERTSAEPTADVSPVAAAATLPTDAHAGTDTDRPPVLSEPEPKPQSDRFRRLFVQVGLSVGTAWLSHGMPVDRNPDPSNVFINGRTGQPVADATQVDPHDLRLTGARINRRGDASQDPGLQRQTSWEADRDSYDGYVDETGQQRPFTASRCPSDGKKTGPNLNPSAGDENPWRNNSPYPSSYCMRIKRPGLSQPQLSVRVAAGVFVTERLALALIGRWQIGHGVGLFAPVLLGGRLEYIVTPLRATGLMVSGFVGASIGQIQARPKFDDPTGDEPWIKSGLLGGHGGVNIRYRVTPHFGFFVAPELDVQFPDSLVNADLTAGGEMALF